MSLELHYVYSICLARINNMSDAIRATREVFIATFKQLHAFKDYDHFEVWLGKLTVTYCDNWLHGKIKLSDFMLQNSSPTGYQEPIGDIGRIYNAVKTLNIEIRQILLVYYFNDNDSFCISKLIGHEPAAVRIALASARLELHELISDEKEYCKDLVDKITQFAVGSLAVNDSIELQKHIVDCNYCRQYLTRLKADEKLINEFVKGLDEPLVNIPKDVLATIESQGFEKLLKNGDEKLKAAKSKLTKMSGLLFIVIFAIIMIFVLKMIGRQADDTRKNSSLSVQELFEREKEMLGIASKNAQMKRHSQDILALSKSGDITGLIAVLKDDKYDIPVKIFVANVLSSLSATDAIGALEKLSLKMDKAVNPFSIALEKIRAAQPSPVILAGYIADSNDEPIQDVLVAIDSNDSLLGKTDDHGYYEVVGDIETGKYFIEISCPNCPDQNIVSLQLVSGQIVERDFTVTLEEPNDVNLLPSLPSETIDSNKMAVDSNSPLGEFSIVGTLVFDIPEKAGKIEISAISSSEKIYSAVIAPDSNSFEITSLPDETYTILLRGANVNSAVIEDVNVYQEIEIPVTIKQ